MSEPEIKRRKKKDYKGFEDIVKKVKDAIYKHGKTQVLYIKAVGFVVRRTISEKNQNLIDEGKAELVCSYVRGVTTEHIVDDCIWTLDEMIKQRRAA